MTRKQQRTILIVDDTPHDRQTYRRYLQADLNSNYTILEEELAEEALALCQKQMIDGILLDFLLPDLDGFEFLAQLKARGGEKCPPVIMITGQGNEAVAAKAIKVGAEDYLVKGNITPDSLRFAMHAAIENAQLHRKLQQSEERFRTSVENMIDCFSILSAIRNQSGQIVDFKMDYLNATALESHKITAKEMEKSLCQLFPDFYQSELFREYCQVVETGQPLIKESQDYSILGNEYFNKVYDIRVSKLGDGLVTSWRDVTARKQAEVLRQQQIERERIVNQIAQQVRQSLNLQEILNTTVTEVRQFLQTDRVIVFRLEPDGNGKVVAESVGYEWVSILSTNIYDPCFKKTYIEIYRQGLVTKRADIFTAEIDPCHLELLTLYQVRANLVVPILQDKGLWGVLIAHHCAAPREWQPLEVELLKQLTTQVGIAIKQSELYQKVGNELLERQRAEEGLRQSEALFRGVFESNLIGILFWNNAGKIEDANETFCRMIGYSREELQAQKVYYQDITPPEYHQLDTETFEVVQKTGYCSPIEKEYIRKDGKRLPILLGGAYLPGSRDRGVSFVLDISEQKKLEKERQNLLLEAQKAREQAEIANQTKDEFMAIISHELRSPLSAIVGWTQLIKRDNLDAEKTKSALEIIERNAKFQNLLIEDLLDMSRLIRGNLRLDITQVNLADVIQTSIANLRLSAEAKNIQLQWEFTDRVVKVLGDSHRLQQIVTNLLSNAIKFTADGGKVEVELSVVSKQAISQLTNLSSQLKKIPENGYAQIRVMDTGKGISPDFLPYVFDRFRQANSSIHAKDGVGLGLAIVHHLVELHNGTVAAASPGEGLGATFTVILPLLCGEEVENKELLTENREQETVQNSKLKTFFPSPLPLQDVRILVVDDELDSRELLRCALETEGAVVRTASSAREALTLLQEFDAEILISDIGMPEEDGYSLLRQVRQLESKQLRQIPAIALTAYAKTEDREQALSMGFEQYITKPAELNQLREAIINLMPAKKSGKLKIN